METTGAPAADALRIHAIERASRAERLDEVRRMIATGQARWVREMAGLTETAMAREVPCTQAAISAWELQRRVPRGGAGMAYADLLLKLRDRVIAEVFAQVQT